MSTRSFIGHGTNEERQMGVGDDDVLNSFFERMSKKDNLAEWRMRLCGMGKEADVEKQKRIGAYRMEARGDLCHED